MEWLNQLKRKAKELKQNILPVYYALWDRRTPWTAKVMAAVTVGYLMSPIDLIPDFIPVLGILDDLILVPLMIRFTISLIPKELISEFREKVKAGEKLKKNWIFAVPVIILYGILLWLVIKKNLRM